jgi:hypothetical protein
MLILLFSFVGPQLQAQTAATLTGVITNGVTGSPVTGAKILVDTHTAYSVSGGLYSVVVDPAGTFPVICSKAGYAAFTSAPVTFQPGETVTLDIPLLESANPPASVTATVDSSGSPPVVQLSWQVPSGQYEILYDDGIQDNFTVWANQGNMNAVRFTPAGYPVTIRGGSVHIGEPGNYPPGSTPLVPFQVSVYDATGPGGTPGTKIAGPFDVTPAALGWVEFTFPSPPTLTGGNFYLVKIQGGNAPDAAGLAVDETNFQFRSYYRFVTGSGPWVPANGNYMIRAVTEGPGGPLLLTDNPESLQGYHLWRLRQGEEMNPAAWTDLGPESSNTATDPDWCILPCGPYRWGVVSVYTGNRLSPATFSNVIGKCWTASVQVEVTLSCTTTPVSGTFVRLKNLVYPDSLYSGMVDTLGRIIFPEVWKGTYELMVTRFGYETSATNIGISSDASLPVFLLQEKNPVTNLTVDDKTLLSTWNRPREVKVLFSETWESGTFTANDWTLQGGVNWVISQAEGNPAPSAMFTWNPQQADYDQSLISKIIGGENAPSLTLNYDLYLDSFGNSTLNQLAVELWNGASWIPLEGYDNQSGDIPWTSEQVDLTAFSGQDFRIRFRAYGEDTYDINNWNIDNIEVIGSESQNSGSCVLGYFYYLDNILCGFVTDTTFTIPAGLVQYGNTYTSCVVAAYGSGYSDPDCYSFVSHYLPPPGNLEGEAIEDAAYLTWDKPENAKIKGEILDPPPGLMGYTLYRDSLFLVYISDPDTLYYYDLGLYPGTYSYTVTAKYDLSAYGFPGQFDESCPEGPAEVEISYGRPLPFYEPWDQGSFTFNDWSFEPDQGNWVISTAIGNPEPSAEFFFEPLLTEYSHSLVSPVLSADGILCAKIYLDYDLRYIDTKPTEEEQLSVELFFYNNWHTWTTYVNNGNLAWTGEHLDITPVMGTAFMVRFRAHGLNSDNMLRWNIDNIHVYAIANPPENLLGDALGFDVLLTWSPPSCFTGNILSEGFEEEFFPPANWTALITNPAYTWYHSDLSDPLGVHSGEHAAALKWDYNHQDEWLVAQDVQVTGDLLFWSFAFQGSVNADHYYVQVSEDDGATWITLLDLSALPPYPGPGGYNQWNEPYAVDLSSYMGQVVDIAWHAVDGNGQGLWYNWSIDDCSIGNKKLSLNDKKSFPGYDVYRSLSGTGEFEKINASPVPDTTYLDPSLPPAAYRYYVTAVVDGCSSGVSSDTILVDVITGTGQLEPASILVFPNPASDRVQITSSTVISAVEIISSQGQTVLSLFPPINNSLTVNVNLLPAGVYIFRIRINNDLIFRRVTVLR